MRDKFSYRERILFLLTCMIGVMYFGAFKYTLPLYDSYRKKALKIEKAQTIKNQRDKIEQKHDLLRLDRDVYVNSFVYNNPDQLRSKINRRIEELNISKVIRIDYQNFNLYLKEENKKILDLEINGVGNFLALMDFVTHFVNGPFWMQIKEIELTRSKNKPEQVTMKVKLSKTMYILLNQHQQENRI